MRQLRKREGLGFMVGGGIHNCTHCLAASWATPLGSSSQFPWASVVERMGAGFSVLHHAKTVPGGLLQEDVTHSLQAFLRAAVTLRFSSSARALASWAHAPRSSGVALPEVTYFEVP